ncbi:hypothetical protein PICMEDRAFT_16580 [Pichia membranifaciens NRRL Y-2026]|uniref:Flavin reductase like domain-containing protein n=1 Tax=Pichia membranifaciens NRRL Y-2026 TaxID=763406 RepID=A0A1E3NKS5_9ASCO|nr:hypothetical protein PICMEDRAFT_16580 [Pichia membranifaciens NRRL Y-2026]ODQ46752.1 hypothetical protein PICMEDRAFT_16580 [Pichia membranifaciens NRRL Y-2026]
MILTASFSGKPEIGKMHGTTLSSVSSLTVNPEPIVQFNIQVPSATSKSIQDNKYLALHILKPSNDSVRLARNFSLGSRYINEPQPETRNTNNSSARKSTTPFERIDKDQWSLFENVMHNKRPGSIRLDSDLHLPILTKDSERILICQKYKVFKVYNHEIWTCKVKEILVNIDDDVKTGGLLYFDRKFHHVGEALIEVKKDEKEIQKLET